MSLQLLTIVFILLATSACSNESTRLKPNHLPDIINHTFKSKYHGELTFISMNEAELSDDGINYVCGYSYVNGRLRLELRWHGMTTAKYFEVTPEGLVDEDGDVFYNDDIYEKLNRTIVRKIDVSTDGNLTRDLVCQFSALKVGMKALDVDFQRVKAELECVPIVQSAEVTWKDAETIGIHILERVPIAAIPNHDNSFRLGITSDGFVVGVCSTNLPPIYGVNPDALRPGIRVDDYDTLRALTALDFCNAASLSSSVKVVSVDVSNSDYLEMRLVQGELILIPKTNLYSDLHALERILEMSTSRGKHISSIDMRGGEPFRIEYR